MSSEEQNNDFVSEPFSYTKEQRQNRKNHTIKAYTLFYVAQNLSEPIGEANRVDEGYWCCKKYEMQAVSLRKPTGSWVVLPTSMFQTTVRLPVEYPTASESVMVETLTGGLGTASSSAGVDASGGVMIRQKNKPFESDDYHFDFDSDIYASKLKEQAEREGYQMIPAARTTLSASLNTNSSAVIPTLFAMGKQKNMVDDNSKLYQDIVVNRIFSENYPVESNPEDGSTIQRMFHAYVPRHGGEEELPPGLLPDENERKRDRMLREIGSQLQRMKEQDTKAAALLEKERIEAEKEYQRKLAEITSRLRESTIQEMTTGAVYNAETVSEEEQEEKS
jgi:hypothetical protein